VTQSRSAALVSASTKRGLVPVWEAEPAWLVAVTRSDANLDGSGGGDLNTTGATAASTTPRRSGSSGSAEPGRWASRRLVGIARRLGAKTRAA
jgi:hypothetical protein